jgi:hypothetical protein
VSNESEAFTAFSIGQCPSSNLSPPLNISAVLTGTITSKFIGPRTCIGRKFATTEAVCFLTMLLREYKVQPILQGKEGKEEWKNRVIDAKVMLTLGIKDVPVKFVRRGKD